MQCIESRMEGETRVLLLRHGQTSAPDRFHGAESDVGLSDLGIRQADALAAHLAGLRPDAVYSSGMRRALETAQRIAQSCGLEVQVAQALHERRMGALSGLPRQEGLPRYIEEKARWIAGDLDFAHDGAESFRQTRDRAVKTLQEIVDRCPGQTIVVVTHGVVIRVLLTSLLAEYQPSDFDRIGIDNAALNDLRWNGRGWRASVLNDRVAALP